MTIKGSKTGRNPAAGAKAGAEATRAAASSRKCLKLSISLDFIEIHIHEIQARN